MQEPRRIKPPGSQGISGQSMLVILAAVVFIALIVAGRLGGLYVDWLWFQSVAMDRVFATRLFAQAALFLIAALAFFVVFTVNVVVAMRVARKRDIISVLMQPAGSTQMPPLLKAGFIIAGALLALLVGSGLAGSWDVVLRYLNPTAFGVADPVFRQDVSFFVFTLPMYGLLYGWFLGTIVLTLLAVLAVYVVRFILPQLPTGEDSLENQMANLRLDLALGPGVKAHLSILVALLALGFAWRHWLDIFGLVYSSTGLIFGAGYTDVHARWPALWLMVGTAVLFALLVLVNIRRRGYALAVVGLVLWLGAAILGGAVYPGIVQRFQVLPSELDQERPYLSSNINLTNQAYRLDAISEADYPAEDAVTAADIADNPATIKNIRLWDPDPLLNTYNQIQSIRLYYDFVDVDIDRYMIDGEYRQVMLSAREMSPAKLSGQAQTWVNRRLQFTHGYGLAMSPVNEVTPEGLPDLFMRDVPPQGKLALTRPEIYYGENTNDFVIVKTTTAEFDYPKGDQNVYVTYQGDSGVGVGAFLRRLLFAWQFGDMNILLTGSITPESRIMYHRNIKERAQMVAPFLLYDGDPYLVVADKRLYWVLDAYTYTDRYPYSQPVRLGERGSVNYLRNSVKVVVDAYDGSLHYYLADPSDPLIRTYAAIFPGLFAPLDQMPAELRSHLRYPADLFRVQAELYRTYHMRDPRVFYNKEDLWSIPSDIHADKPTVMQPYYVIMRLPGEQREEFALILPFTPPEKNNMITWLAARADGDAYGKLVAYRYPKDKLVFGPTQIEARIDQDPRISEQLTLWNQAGSRVIRGDMIVIPIGKSNLYVEPIYLQSEQTKLPEMKRVVLATGGRVVMEPTVSDGLARLFGAPATAVAPPPAAPAAPGPAPAKKELSAAAKSLLDRVAKLQGELKGLENDLRQLMESTGGTQ